MLSYAGRRILASIPVLVLASILVFVLVRELGADPARLRCAQSRDNSCLARERAHLGLDRALPVQYVDFMSDFVRGDWGTSQRTDRSVSASIGDNLWDTAQLAFFGVLFSAGIAVAVGVYSARRAYSAGDYLFTGIAFAGIAMPTFWFGLLAIQYLSHGLQQLVGSNEPIFYSVPNPVGSGVVDYFRELALPVLVLSVQLVAGWSRYQRSAMLGELDRDYLRSARAKGLSRRAVVWKHGLRNSMGSLITVLFGGLIVTERVFSRPGMGTLLVDAVTNGDTNVVIPWMLVTGAIVIGLNLVADLVYGLLDPRVRLEGRSV